MPRAGCRRGRSQVGVRRLGRRSRPGAPPAAAPPSARPPSWWRSAWSRRSWTTSPRCWSDGAAAGAGCRPGPGYRVPLEASVAPLCQRLGLRAAAHRARVGLRRRHAGGGPRGGADRARRGGRGADRRPGFDGQPAGRRGHDPAGRAVAAQRARRLPPLRSAARRPGHGRRRGDVRARVRGARARPRGAAAGAGAGLGQQPGRLPGDGTAARRQAAAGGHRPGAGPGGPAPAGGRLRQRPRHRDPAQRSRRGPRHPPGARGTATSRCPRSRAPSAT